MSKLNNPFVIGKYVSREYFCDREEETGQLSHHLQNGRNVTLMSERRLGKTGLIAHTFANAWDAEQYYTFIIDIYTAHNLREFVCLLANALFRKLVRKQSLFSRLVQLVHSIQTTVTYNTVTGEPEVNIGLGEINQPEVTLDELFSYMEEADRPCIVAIDEFQKIADFEEDNMEAILRTKIQHLKNTQFVFAGSEQHLLESIFNDPKRPFYNSVVFMKLFPIEKHAYITFCERLFTDYGKRVSPELVARLYDYFKGVTWYLQLSLNEAFSMTERGAEISLDAFPLILRHMVDTKRFTFEDRYSSLTEKQKIVLQAIAQEYPETPMPTSKDFIVKYHLKTASSVQTAIKGLVEKGIMRDFQGQKQVVDLLFILWLKNN